MVTFLRRRAAFVLLCSAVLIEPVAAQLVGTALVNQPILDQVSATERGGTYHTDLYQGFDRAAADSISADTQVILINYKNSQHENELLACPFIGHLNHDVSAHHSGRVNGGSVKGPVQAVIRGSTRCSSLTQRVKAWSACESFLNFSTCRQRSHSGSRNRSPIATILTKCSTPQNITL